eukprot:scaffold448_cov156-Amphora_coffeaeformis.AAC.5
MIDNTTIRNAEGLGEHWWDHQEDRVTNRTSHDKFSIVCAALPKRHNWRLARSGRLVFFWEFFGRQEDRFKKKPGPPHHHPHEQAPVVRPSSELSNN